LAGTQCITNNRRFFLPKFVVFTLLILTRVCAGPSEKFEIYTFKNSER